MFHIVLFEPEIPNNTGNIIRLCANTGAELHLIEPLGFFLTEKHLLRAGLDYHDKMNLHQYPSLTAFGKTRKDQRNYFYLSTHGARSLFEAHFSPGDIFVFGPETRGLPDSILKAAPVERILRIPMQASSRSINLANSVAITIYEAWRQIGFAAAGK